MVERIIDAQEVALRMIFATNPLAQLKQAHPDLSTAELHVMMKKFTFDNTLAIVILEDEPTQRQREIVHKALSKRIINEGNVLRQTLKEIYHNIYEISEA